MRPDIVRRHARELQGMREKDREERAMRANRERAHLSHDMRVLTGQEGWDKYLALVEALQVPDRKELAALVYASERSNYENNESVASRHFRMSVLRERIRARDECLRIPQELFAASRKDVPETE